ncbi:lipopolysaccharide biosynthesis protein [Terrabacter sp. Ter38]|uniref:lipopolysaccharide biosynthesis protein n=1 Tax=Terrabacter sp. Ter38 TaxID=2926030 RepID=UPI00211971A1|nr:lipopolysaccharide biosynthesis protein [Terrabacter sp. Ter38]
MRTRTALGFAVGPVTTALISLVAVPIVAWAFSPEDVARYNLLQIFVSFAVLLVTLGLDQGYVRHFHEAHDRAVLLRSCVLPSALLFAALAVPAAIASGPLADLLLGSSDARVFPIAIACAAAAIISRFLSLILRMEERALAFSASQLIPKAVFLVAIGLLLIFVVRRDFLTLSYAFLASWVTVAAVTGWSTRTHWQKAVRVRTDRDLVRSLIRYSAPLIFAGLAYWALTATSAMALRYLSSLSELGVYSVALTFAGAAIVVQTIFSVVWAPIVYRWVAQGADLERVDVVTHQVLAVVTAVLVLVGSLSWLTDVVLPPTYDGVKYLVIGSILQPLLYTLSEATGIGINITRRTVWSVWCTLFALIVSVGLNLALTPALGAKGAVVANTLAYFAFFVARTEASVHTWRHFPRKRLYAVTGFAVAGALATVVLGPASGYWYAVGWAVLGPVVIWIFRHQWGTIVRLRGVPVSA